jgi:hypothetical protein
VFISDRPSDPDDGTMYPREILKIFEPLNLPKTDQDKIYFKNLEAVTLRRLMKS